MTLFEIKEQINKLSDKDLEKTAYVCDLFDETMFYLTLVNDASFCFDSCSMKRP